MILHFISEWFGRREQCASGSNASNANEIIGKWSVWATISHRIWFNDLLNNQLLLQRTFVHSSSGSSHRLIDVFSNKHMEMRMHNEWMNWTANRFRRSPDNRHSLAIVICPRRSGRDTMVYAVCLMCAPLLLHAIRIEDWIWFMFEESIQSYLFVQQEQQHCLQCVRLCYTHTNV